MKALRIENMALSIVIRDGLPAIAVCHEPLKASLKAVLKLTMDTIYFVHG